MMKFHDMFNRVITLTLLAGLSVGSQKMPERKEILFQLFSLLTVITQSVNLLLVTYLMIFRWQTIRDPTLSASAFFLFTYSIFITVYFYVARERFAEFLRRIDAATFMLYQNPLCNKTRFSVSLTKVVKQSSKYAMGYFIFMAVATLMNSVSCMVNYWFKLSDKPQLAFQYPFDPSESPSYDVAIVYQMVTGLICVAKKCASESFFAALFVYLHSCYKQLGDMFTEVFQQNNGNDLKLWIQIHQQYQTLTEDLVQLYSPCLVIYFIELFTCMTFVIFSVTQQTRCYMLPEYVGLAGYWSMSISIFCILCILGTKIMDQNEELWNIIYKSDWHVSTTEIKKYLLVVGQRLQSPDRVCVFRSKTFDLSKTTFLWVIQAIVSSYVTLTQIKATGNPNGQCKHM